MDSKLKVLSESQLHDYKKHGAITGIDVLTAGEVDYYRDCLERFEQELGMPLMSYPERPTIWVKSHLLFRWIDAIVRHPKILDAIEDIIGPNIRVWQNNFFIKEPQAPSFVTWHQDGAYSGIVPAEVTSVWVALTHSNEEMGCVKVLQGSHQRGLRVHVDRESPGNLLKRGQRVEVLEDVPIINLTLQPGEMSIHHTYAVHCSEPNTSSERRIGVMTAYVPTHCRYMGTGKNRMRAALVRGEDTYGHFEDEPRPVVDFGIKERAEHRDSMERYLSNVVSEDKQLEGAVTRAK